MLYEVITCEAGTLLDSRVAILLVLGITALAVSGLGGIRNNFV